MRVLALVSCPAKRKVSSALCRLNMGQSLEEVLLQEGGSQQCFRSLNEFMIMQAKQMSIHRGANDNSLATRKISSALQAHGLREFVYFECQRCARQLHIQIGISAAITRTTFTHAGPVQQAGQVGSALCRHRVGEGKVSLRSEVVSACKVTSAGAWHLHMTQSAGIPLIYYNLSLREGDECR